MSNFPKGGNSLKRGAKLQIYCEDEDNMSSLGKIHEEVALKPIETLVTSEIVAHTSRGATFFLEDGGDIEFFLHDKPQEFYKTEACIVRNRTLPYLYTVRVPANTPSHMIAKYTKMFENRSTIAVRKARYYANSPYPNEREIGINCGQEYNESISENTSGSFTSHEGPRPPIYFTCKHPEDAIANSQTYRVPIVEEYAVYPELVNRVQSYLDTTVPEDKPSVIGSDDCNAKSSTTDSSKFPLSANELQRHSHAYENIDLEFGFNQQEKHVKKKQSPYVSRGPADWVEHDCHTSHGFAMHANSGGYGRMFHPHMSTTHQYVQDPMLIMRQMQNREMQGSFIPVIPVRSSNEVTIPLPPRHLNKKTNALYKTEMCRNWNEIGECRYGRSCQFAHGRKELRTVPRHGQWKTKTCMAWLHGGCTYGSRCCYAHEIIDDNTSQPQSPTSTEPGSSVNLGDAGESKFSDFFASRCWA